MTSLQMDGSVPGYLPVTESDTVNPASGPPATGALAR